jgi:DNA-binding SARP family transcriptional activator
LQEPVHRAVMRLYVQLGRRASALRQYQLSHAAVSVESPSTAPPVPAEAPTLRTPCRASCRSSGARQRSAGYGRRCTGRGRDTASSWS